MTFLRTLLPAVLLALAVAAPASAAAPLPDAVMSSNVEYLGSIQQDVGLTTGAKVVGDRMFVTSGKNISIYEVAVMIDSEPGTRSAPVAPWRTRDRASSSRFGARPHMTDVVPKPASPIAKTFRRP